MGFIVTAQWATHGFLEQEFFTWIVLAPRLPDAQPTDKYWTRPLFYLNISNARNVVAALGRVGIMQDTQNSSISQQTKALVEKLLLGRFTLPEIAKITGISEQ